MQHQTQIELIARVLDLVQRRTTDMVDGETFHPVDRYLDPQRFRREVDLLFRRGPLIVGHVSQVARPGDYFTHDATGLPLVVMRGRDDRVRTFLNVCRHRGMRVVEEACGNKNSLACPYHGWTYGLDGTLAGLPHRYGFPNLDTTTSGLVELPTEVGCGFVWVVPTVGESIDVAAHLGPLAEDLASLGIAEHSIYESRLVERALNWKLGFDIFLEGYHVRRTHDATIAPVFLDNVGLYDSFAPHLRNLFPKRSIVELRDVDRQAWQLRQHANVLYVIFPNTSLLVQPDHLSLLHSFPLAPDRTRTLAYTLIPEPAASDKARRHWDANNAIFYAAIDEDYAMGEAIQRGLASGANASLRFGRFEQALARFHRAVDAAIERDD
jgi:phenylpropionate dioxygenase-like ring-hydroxylating dioxygenase large terminal subunit